MEKALVELKGGPAVPAGSLFYIVMTTTRPTGAPKKKASSKKNPSSEKKKPSSDKKKKTGSSGEKKPKKTVKKAEKATKPKKTAGKTTSVKGGSDRKALLDLKKSLGELKTLMKK